MLVSTPKVPKIWWPKLLKTASSDHCTVVWGTLTMEPPRISARTLYRLKVESLHYIFATDSMGLSSFKFPWRLRKVRHLCSRMWHGRSRSSKVDGFGRNRKGIQDFLLVISSNLGLILHTFWDTATYWLKIANFSPTPLSFSTLDEGDPFRMCRKPLHILVAGSFTELLVEILWS